MVLYGQVLAQEIDGTYDNTDYEKHYIAIGGTCTIITRTGKTDLVEATINTNLKTITGKLASDIELGFRTWEAETEIIPFEDIQELIFEGFYINEHNRISVYELDQSKVFKLTKIPRGSHKKINEFTTALDLYHNTTGGARA